MFKFDSKTDEQIQAMKESTLLEAGEYSFEVRAVTQTVSKSGNQMLEVLLGITDKNGEVRTIKDYLMAIDSMIFKLKHFCEAIGLSEEYKAGNLDVMKCFDRTGRCKVNVQKGKLKSDGSGYYDDKNGILDYIKSDGTQNHVPDAGKKVDPNLSDDIPF